MGLLQKSLFVSSSMRLLVVGYGICENDEEKEEYQLHSISALTVKWKTNENMLNIEESGVKSGK